MRLLAGREVGREADQAGTKMNQRQNWCLAGQKLGSNRQSLGSSLGVQPCPHGTWESLKLQGQGMEVAGSPAGYWSWEATTCLI